MWRRRLALFIDPTVGDLIEVNEVDFPSITDLARVQLQGIKVDTSFVNEMTPAARLDFCEQASDVLKNSTFKRTLDYLISEQVEFTVKRAQSMDEVLFGRATINGLSLAKEQFEALAALAEEERNKGTKMTKDETQEII